MKFYIWVFFENLLRKFKFLWNLTRVTGTLNEDLCTFLIIASWVIFGIRTVSDNSCRENQNTNFMFSNPFPRIVPFMRWCENVWYSQTVHRWKYDTAHALCIPDNYGKNTETYREYVHERPTNALILFKVYSLSYLLLHVSASAMPSSGSRILSTMTQKVRVTQWAHVSSLRMA
jgi:hypothetical protein